MTVIRLLTALVGTLVLVGCGRTSGFELDRVDCGNGVQEVGEECDFDDLGGTTCASLGLQGGTLSCGSSCLFVVDSCDGQDVCGDGTRQYPEVCDGADLAGQTCEGLGFGGGRLGCSDLCGLDTSGCANAAVCGNDAIEPGEECDGNQLGSATCANLGLGEGTLDCGASCQLDISDCEFQPDCGNGLAEVGELCDGADLAGADCIGAGFYEGQLECSVDCQAHDSSGCRGSCGDGALNGPELCDDAELGGQTCESIGYYPGQLQCGVACDRYNTSRCGGTCGDAVVNGPELCDVNDFAGDSCAARGFYGGNLACNADCDQVDAAGCSGSCGDGVTNGPEVCDGADVGGQSCADFNLDGGPLRCLADCSGLNLASCGSVRIVEIGTGNPDWVELHNPSSAPADLTGWIIEWSGYNQGGTQQTNILTLPAYTLGAGQRVLILDEFNGDGSPPDVDVAAGEIQFHDNIWWGSSAGAVTLIDSALTYVDFVRWSGPDFASPGSLPWADTPAMLTSFNEDWITISRVPEDQDNDVAGDFCIAEATPGAPNTMPCIVPSPPGTLLLTEIDLGDPTDWVELYNPMFQVVDLEGWYVVAINRWGQQSWVELPAYQLAGGAYIALKDDLGGGTDPWVETGGGPGGVDIIHVENFGWREERSGACRLVEPGLNMGVDFVRWEGANSGPGSGDSWDDVPADLPEVPSGSVLGRQSLTDTDTAADWCIQAPSYGVANGSCI